ncbi:MAG: hypothetical protein WAU39_12190 [Polyangiales bacterium]
MTGCGAEGSARSALAGSSALAVEGGDAERPGTPRAGTTGSNLENDAKAKAPPPRASTLTANAIHKLARERGGTDAIWLSLQSSHSPRRSRGS